MQRALQDSVTLRRPAPKRDSTTARFASRFVACAAPCPDMLHYLRTPVAPLQAGELATMPGQPHEFDGWLNLRADQTVPPLRDLCLSRLCCYPNVVQKISPTVVAALPRDVLDQVIGALLSNRLVNDQCLSLFRANHIKVLDFAMCNLLTEASLKTVGTELTHITTLVLSKCEWVSDNTCTVLATLTSLKHLHLAGCEITDEGVTRLVKNGGLLSFDVSHCKQLRANALRDIGRKLENLTHLDVSWLENAQVPEKAFRKLKRLHKLQFLNLSDAKITDSTLGKLVAACTALSTLDISYCAALTDASAAKICKAGMGLKQLLFARSPLEDNDVMKICTTMTKLEVLDLSWSPKITDACLGKLVKMTRLNTLNVTFTNLTRPAINTAVSQHPHVQNLYYWGLKK